MALLDPMRPRTRAEMRELDRRAIETYGIPAIVLMENAGRVAADVACEMARPKDGCVIVLCGRGNNGGDGYVLARHLSNRGYDVRCHDVDPSGAPRASEAAVNAAILRTMGVPVTVHGVPEDQDEMARAVGWASLLVDGLLGTGLTGPVREPYASLIAFLNHRRAPVLALDIPSGLDCDTGEILGRAVRATRTVTFGAPKVGFTRGQGPELTGRVTIAEISIPRRLLEEIPSSGDARS